jgi:CBS-domain-containing membrane protein
MKIREVMQYLENREIPCVREDSDIKEVIEMVIRFPHTRVVYVMDEQRKLRGVITIGSLLRHLFPYHYEGKIHPHGILRDITAETASHLMDSGNVKASPEDTVDFVLERMANTGAKEMAVVDGENRILTDITAVDLLKYYPL